MLNGMNNALAIEGMRAKGREINAGGPGSGRRLGTGGFKKGGDAEYMHQRLTRMGYSQTGNRVGSTFDYKHSTGTSRATLSHSGAWSFTGPPSGSHPYGKTWGGRGRVSFDRHIGAK